MEIEKESAGNLRLNLVESSMTAQQAIKSLNKMIQDGWLYEKAGSISLGLRSTIELKSYIKQKYEDIVFECSMCSNLMTKGEACVNEDCKIRLHKQCSKRRFQSLSEKKCPGCMSEWITTWE